jgi:hypothetical protein
VRVQDEEGTVAGGLVVVDAQQSVRQHTAADLLAHNAQRRISRCVFVSVRV